MNSWHSPSEDIFVMICVGNLFNFSYMPKYTTSYLSTNLDIKYISPGTNGYFISDLWCIYSPWTWGIPPRPLSARRWTPRAQALSPSPPSASARAARPTWNQFECEFNAWINLFPLSSLVFRKFPETDVPFWSLCHIWRRLLTVKMNFKSGQRKQDLMETSSSCGP